MTLPSSYFIMKLNMPRITLIHIPVYNMNLQVSQEEHMVSYHNIDVLLNALLNSLRPNDAYMRQETNHHWFK